MSYRLANETKKINSYLESDNVPQLQKLNELARIVNNAPTLKLKVDLQFQKQEITLAF